MGQRKSERCSDFEIRWKKWMLPKGFLSEHKAGNPLLWLCSKTILAFDLSINSTFDSSQIDRPALFSTSLRAHVQDQPDK